MDFKLGDRVIKKDNVQMVGTVVEIENEFIFVEWDDPKHRERFPRVWKSEDLINIT